MEATKKERKKVDFGGKVPHPGMPVAYYREGTRYLPAMLIEQRATEGCWDLNVLRVGSLWGKTNCMFSSTPRPGHWSFLPD